MAPVPPVGRARGRPRVRRDAREDHLPGADEYAAVAPAIGVHNHDAMSAGHVVALQRTVGNRAVARLFAVQRESTSELTEHAAEHVNVIDAVHELRRAIDQTEVNDKDNTRKVDFKVVDRVLANLSPSQIAA